MSYNSIKLVKDTEDVHTTISTDAYNKLKKYGNGYLNLGIIRVIEIAEMNLKIPNRLCRGCGRLKLEICTLINAKPTYAEHCEFKQ